MKTVEIEVEQLAVYLKAIMALEAELYAFKELYQWVLDSRRLEGAEVLHQLLQLRALGRDEAIAKYGDPIRELASASEQSSVDSTLAKFRKSLPTPWTN